MGDHHELHRKGHHLLSSFDLHLHLVHLAESVCEDDFGHPQHSGIDMYRCSGDRGELGKRILMKPLKMTILASDLVHLQLSHIVHIGDDSVDNRRVEGLGIEIQHAIVDVVLGLLENISFRSGRRMSPLAAAQQPPGHRERGLALDVVVLERAVVLKMHALEGREKLIPDHALKVVACAKVVDLAPELLESEVDGVAVLQAVERDGAEVEGLDEDLHGALLRFLAVGVLAGLAVGVVIVHGAVLVLDLRLVVVVVIRVLLVQHAVLPDVVLVPTLLLQELVKVGSACMWFPRVVVVAEVAAELSSEMTLRA